MLDALSYLPTFLCNKKYSLHCMCWYRYLLWGIPKLSPSFLLWQLWGSWHCHRTAIKNKDKKIIVSYHILSGEFLFSMAAAKKRERTSCFCGPCFYSILKRPCFLQNIYTKVHTTYIVVVRSKKNYNLYVSGISMIIIVWLDLF